jgi:hypothetical protein
LLRAVWNKGTENRGIGKNTGKEYECCSKTEERKTTGTIQDGVFGTHEF